MDEPTSGTRALPGGDPTPERDEIVRERGIDPVGGMTPAKRNTALIFAGTAMVLGILWVNSGTKTTSGVGVMATSDAARQRPDLTARETVAYDAVAPQPKPLGTGDPNAPVLNPNVPAGSPLAGPDGQVVPAMQLGATPPGASQQHVSIADQARRSTLIAYGGQDRTAGAAPSPGDGQPTGAPGTADGSEAGADRPGGAPNALDMLRQSSAVGEARASMLPNRNFLITAGTLIPCTLQTAMNSAQPGYTSCIIPRDIYSENGRVILMEKGTRDSANIAAACNKGRTAFSSCGHARSRRRACASISLRQDRTPSGAPAWRARSTPFSGRVSAARSCSHWSMMPLILPDRRLRAATIISPTRPARRARARASLSRTASTFVRS